jgi:hypothetical protein
VGKLVLPYPPDVARALAKRAAYLYGRLIAEYPDGLDLQLQAAELARQELEHGKL